MVGALYAPGPYFAHFHCRNSGPHSSHLFCKRKNLVTVINCHSFIWHNVFGTVAGCSKAVFQRSWAKKKTGHAKNGKILSF